MRNKKIFSAVISIAMCLSMLPITVNAEDNDNIFTDNIADTYNLNNVWGELEEDNSFDENDINDYEVEYADIFQVGNYFSLGDNNISTYSDLNNWNVSPNKALISKNAFTLKEGDMIDFNISLSPAVDSTKLKIGLYNVDTKKTTYINRKTDDKLVGKYTVKVGGNYKLRAENKTSDITVQLTGSYVIVEFDSFVPVDHISQETNWCWAASIEMCAKSLGYNSKTQNDIVYAVKGSYNHVGGSDANITSGVQYATGGTAVNTTITGGDYTTTNTTALTVTEIKSELDADRPIIAIFTHVNVSGRHAVVINGLSKSKVYIRIIDPDPNKVAPQYYKYSEAITNNVSEWTGTHKLTKQAKT